MKHNRYYIFFILLFLSNYCLWCQQDLFKQLSVNEGLSHSDAICLVQDNYSFLWIGTNSGFNKYDGYSIQTYKWEPNDFSSIPGNRILKLIATKDKIWILIENKGLFYYNLLTESYVLVKKIPELSPNNFMFDLGQNNNLWLFQKTIGLIKISIPDVNFSSNKQIKKETIFFEKKEILQPELRKLIRIGKKQYFISFDGKFYEYSNNKIVTYDESNIGVYRTAIAYNNSNILVGLDEGLFLWNYSLKSKQRIPILLDGKNISKKIKLNCIYKVNKDYYLGTENGLYKARLLDKDGLKLFVEYKTLSNVKVNSIFKDKFDLLWVASSGYGLFYKNLKKLPFGHIYQSQDNDKKDVNIFSKNYTSAILKEKNKNILWLGTRNGLYLYDLVSKKYTEQVKELKNQHIRFIFQDSNSEIWVGTFDNGVYRYHNKILIKHYKKISNNPYSISSNHIISISEDHLGRIWLANFHDGIDIYNKTSNSFKHLFHEPFNKQSLGSDNINYLFFHKERKEMYVSTRDAGITVIYFDKKPEFHFEHIRSNNSLNNLSTNYIWSINSNSLDTLFVGTIGGGLNILKKDKNNNYQIEYITSNMGLADNDIESILIDKHHRVWMGGRGISVYHPKTKNITNYDVNDGLQSNSFKIGSSFYDDKEDIMYFGGVNGINFFNPNLIKASSLVTDVSITGIEIFSKPINVGDTLSNRVLLHSKITDNTTISLKAEENDFTLNITPLNFTAPKSNKIKYKLVPYQKNWIERSYPDFNITYSNLPAGDYTFEIQTSNKDAIWSSKNSKLKIRVEKFWYKTNIAILLYLASLLGILYLFKTQTTNRQKIKEKLKIAEKEQLLNQGKLEFFTKISHEIRTPLTLISGPLDDLIYNRITISNKEEVLKSMSRHVNRLLNMVNKLLDFRKMELGHDVLKASSTEINEFVYEIFMFFKGKAYSKIINYDFIKLPHEITVYIDKEKIETILINLLSNAFKFTPNGGKISIKLEVKGDKNKESVFNDFDEPIENYIEISIKDTGRGIPFAMKDKIFNQYYQIEENSSFESIGNGIGLALVKSICNLHHLKIDIDSTTKDGSIFLLRIPFGKNYLGNDETVEVDSYIKPKPTLVLHQTPLVDLDQSAMDIIDKNFSVNKKILLVEDNPEIRLYLTQHLKAFFKVLYAENGSIGFEIAMKERPDIIISDVMMPEMNGMEFSKLIKTNDELHHIPIILLTALASTSHELEGLKLGIEDYIRKPFNIEVLLAKIFTILENRKFISEYYSKQLHFTPKSMDSLTDDEIFLQKLIKFISENLTNEELNVALISSHMAMGRTKLYIKIKENTGMSIVEFVRDLKLQKAETLILNSSQTIEQISFHVGINDLKYFRKHFKRKYRYSPTQYKKSKL